jgi:hypothetical protein
MTVWGKDIFACLRHIPCSINVSNYFTKSLPLSRHELLSPFIAVDDVPTIFPELNVHSSPAFAFFFLHHA